MDYTIFVAVELIFCAEFSEWIIGCVCHKQVYSMVVGCIGDVLVVCTGICGMRLGCIQEWRYQRTFCVVPI